MQTPLKVPRESPFHELPCDSHIVDPNAVASLGNKGSSQPEAYRRLMKCNSSFQVGRSMGKKETGDRLV